MSFLTRLLHKEPEIKDPEDTPIERVSTAVLVGRALTGQPARDYRNIFGQQQAFSGLHKHHDGFGDPLHDWVEKRIQAIEATCTECGKVELHSNHRGPLKGQRVKTLGHAPNPRLAKLVVTTKDRHRPRPSLVQRNTEWKGYYEAGQSVESIAALYDCPPSRVYDVLKRTRTVMRKRGPKPETAARSVEILRLRSEELLTYDEIGAKFGITRERVRQILSQSGADIKALDAARRATLHPAKHQPRICGICGDEIPSMAATTRETSRAHKATHRERFGRFGRLGQRSTPEQNAQRAAIAADYVAGMKEDDLQAKYGVVGTMITYALLQNGLKRNRNLVHRLPTHAASVARADAIVADLKSGMTRKDAAVKNGVSDTLVRQIAQKNGLPYRDYSMPTDEERADWAARYQAGATYRQIADETGRSYEAISRYIRQSGLAR